MGQMVRRAATSLLLILVVALAARVGFAWHEARKISAEVLGTVPFQTETGHIAYSVATGRGFSSPFQRDTGPTAWLAPVYPLLVAGIFKTFGIYTRGAFLAAIFLNILFSAATCVPIFYAGKKIASAGVGARAAWLWALFPNAIMIPFEWVWDTSLAALLAATILWATLRVAESRRWRDWSGYGLLWGATLMTNPALGSVLPLLLGWLGYRMRREGSFLLRRPAVAAALAVFCCLPWTARNFVVFHRFIPFRSNFGFELYIGNNENYDERHRNLPAVITQDREILRYLKMGEVAFMAEEKRKALAFMRTHPLVEVELFTKRIVDFWMGTAEPLKTFRESDSPLIRGILLGNFLSAAGGLLGVVVLFSRRSPPAFPLAAFLVVFPLLYYLTHTSLRYRHPIDPIVLVLTATVVGEGLAVFRSRVTGKDSLVG